MIVWIDKEKRRQTRKSSIIRMLLLTRISQCQRSFYGVSWRWLVPIVAFCLTGAAPPCATPCDSAVWVHTQPVLPLTHEMLALLLLASQVEQPLSLLRWCVSRRLAILTALICSSSSSFLFNEEAVRTSSASLLMWQRRVFGDHWKVRGIAAAAKKPMLLAWQMFVFVVVAKLDAWIICLTVRLMLLDLWTQYQSRLRHILIYPRAGLVLRMRLWLWSPSKKLHITQNVAEPISDGNLFRMLDELRQS